MQHTFRRIHVLYNILMQPRDILPKSRLYQDVRLRLHLGEAQEQ
jgi:hypothetical protein